MNQIFPHANFLEKFFKENVLEKFLEKILLVTTKIWIAVTSLFDIFVLNPIWFVLSSVFFLFLPHRLILVFVGICQTFHI